ncbi:MsnO8 family LLM class oxidoreductase [Salisediminibacterium beveridgei]|uniref:Luciferase family oxidoreductase, group 1 n=1 Tax=Salisediminibacterium beveridgei TaxID=632773 RepID=A0A1D7QU46_9BACI|nr:MsnO8 family LLM class oxidoreductase [Salisediminibacterium beveridgei]AOM82531.1 luciferase family oxidoreductase, group 1 [Salisediminibacterium beveridgei]
MLKTLSLLDSSPILKGQSDAAALRSSVSLAKACEQLGYYRYWATEHHDLAGLSGSVPEVLLAAVGQATGSIRLGSGAILLPHYSPYKVAEVHHALASLNPGRIDIGVGRAPGGNAQTSEALSGEFLKRVYSMPELVDELRGYLDGTAENGLRAAPVPDEKPELWILGTSLKSARMAGERGLSYAFAHFMSDLDPAEAMTEYRSALQANGFYPGEHHSIITVSAICAKTEQLTEELAEPVLKASLQREKNQAAGIAEAVGHSAPEEDTVADEEIMTRLRNQRFIGSAERIHEELNAMCCRAGVDEVMVITHLSSHQERYQSYESLMSSHREYHRNHD